MSKKWKYLIADDGGDVLGTDDRDVALAFHENDSCIIIEDSARTWHYANPSQTRDIEEAQPQEEEEEDDEEDDDE
jgi:hypothetical protein